MEKHEEAIYKFIEKMNYKSDPNVLGVVFYGSYLTGMNNENSDVDLHVILENGELYRGAKLVNGFKIEYFEKPIADLYATCLNDYDKQSNAMKLIIGNGKIIYDKDGSVSELKEFINDKYSNPMPPFSSEECIEYKSILNTRMNRLEEMYINGDVQFPHQYHLMIEKMREVYSRMLGVPRLPIPRVYKIYTDRKYALNFGKERPEQEFIDMYLEAIICSNNEDRFNMLNEMYDYIVGDIKFDPTNYRVKIKSRNNIKFFKSK